MTVDSGPYGAVAFVQRLPRPHCGGLPRRPCRSRTWRRAAHVLPPPEGEGRGRGEAGGADPGSGAARVAPAGQVGRGSGRRGRDCGAAPRAATGRSTPPISEA